MSSIKLIVRQKAGQIISVTVSWQKGLMTQSVSFKMDRKGGSRGSWIEMFWEVLASIFIGHFNKMMFCFLSSVEPDTLYKESTEKTVDNEASKPNEEEPMDEN